MTVTELTNEILYRCGEGYENWGTRALAAFKAAVIDMIASGRYSLFDYHGAYVQGSETISGSTDTIEMSTLIGVGREFIKSIELKLVAGSPSVTTPVSLGSKAEAMAAVLDTALASGIKVWYFYADETGVFISLNETLTSGTIYFAFLTWDNTLLATGSNVVSDYFASEFLAAAIDLSVQRLTAELRS